jgi:hypothetical protein
MPEKHARMPPEKRFALSATLPEWETKKLISEIFTPQIQPVIQRNPAESLPWFSPLRLDGIFPDQAPDGVISVPRPHAFMAGRKARLSRPA